MSCSPRSVASNIASNNPGLLYSMAWPMIKYLFPSADRAARTAVMLATDPELADHSGGYYRSMKHRAKPLEFDAAFSKTLGEVATKATATQR